MDHGLLIKQLGGGAVVGAALRDLGHDVQDVTVRSWCAPTRSIPSAYWVAIKTLADKAGVECSFEALARSVAAESVIEAIGTANDVVPSANNGGEIIGEGAESRPVPFSSPTCSATSGPSERRGANRPCSTSPSADAA